MQSTKNVCFLLGIMPRTGTNYIANLIECHNQAAAIGPLWEDFFVSNSKHLEKFSETSMRFWNRRWDKTGVFLNQNRLLAAIGKGLLSYINEQRIEEEHQDKLLIAKTPTVRNIKNFFRLFPDNKLIIVVRDGRNIIASGERSFRWDFEKAAKDWAKGITNILSFMEENKEKASDILLLKYEDVYQNTHQAIQDILSFLELDEADFDWEKAKHLGISGSSDTVDEFGEVSWQNKVEKTESFKPLERYESWSISQKRRFVWLAGAEAKALGYEVEDVPVNFLFKFVQFSLNITWFFRVLPKTFYYAIKEKRFILKSH